jgi:transcriptional regulator with XRE-family HTH domain
MNIGLALKVGRAAMGYTTLELSRKSGVSAPAISRIENGSNPRMDTVNKLFKAMDKVSFVETYDGLIVNIKTHKADAEIMAAIKGLA